MLCPANRPVLGLAIPIFVLLLSLCAGAQKGETYVAKGELANALNELCERCESVGFMGSILVAKDGKVLLARGDTNPETENNAETLFEIASLTKQFTAAAILRLAEMRKLKLDDSIAKHLPLVPKECEGITVRHLLQHTSGIPGSNNQGHGNDLEAVMEPFLRGGPQHQPGTHWEYWNQGYALLSGIIERCSGKSISEFCRDELFKKAKMKTACFTGDPCPKGAKEALGHSERGNRKALSHPYDEFGYQYRGMGGAVCSLWDLWTWDRALNTTKVLKKNSLKEFFTPGLENYALGWTVEKHGKRTVQSHTGSVRGFLADMRRYVEDDGVLVLLLNEDTQALRGISKLFECCLFEETFVAPPAPLDAETKKSLLGHYETDDHTTLEIVEKRGALVAKLVWSANDLKMEGYIGQGKSAKALCFYDWKRHGSLQIEETKGESVEALLLDGRSLFKRRP